MPRFEIEIAAPPEEVRAVFLDFGRIKEWHTAFIRSIETIPPGKSPIETGDKIKVSVTGAKLQPIIQLNTPTEFRWVGSASGGAFAGEHYFNFFQSKKTPGHTTFVHGEDLTGWLSFLTKPGWPMHGYIDELYASFARDLKSRMEGKTG